MCLTLQLPLQDAVLDGRYGLTLDSVVRIICHVASHIYGVGLRLSGRLNAWKYHVVVHYRLHSSRHCT
jgi:hypothetical protein